MADRGPATPIASMTGYARSEASEGDRYIVWELRSVNSKGLELRFRTPPGLEFIEPALRKTAAAHLSRGAVIANLTVKEAGGASRYAINEAALANALAAIETISARGGFAPPSAEGVLNVKGVVELDEREESQEAREALAAAISDAFLEALNGLAAARQAEGAALMRLIEGQVSEIEKLTAAARDHESAGLSAIRDRLRAQLSELLADTGLAEDRLAQEAALLAVKADIREELDRLEAHAASARELLAVGGVLGRKLDFLSQEFNREANTLCSKVQDMTLKRIGLDLKSVIDQMREQIQNIE